MANRIPPPEPETNRLSQAKKLEEAQKIAAVSSVDPDAQAKKRFQHLMQKPENEEANGEIAAQAQPSPFQSSFYESNQSSDLDLEPIPSPYNSAPPDLNTSSLPGEVPLSDEGLPRSPDYWNRVDIPDQPINEQPQLLEEKPGQLKEGREEKKEPAPKKKSSPHGFEKRPDKPEKKLDPSPFGLPGKPLSKKEFSAKEPSPYAAQNLEEKTTPSSEKKKAEKEIPSAKYWQPEPDESLPTASKRKEKEKPIAPVSRLDKPLDQQETNPSTNVSPFIQKSASGKESEQRGHGRESKSMIEIVQPSTPGFSPAIQAEATSGATAAAPYLRPEMIPLFYQMLGTIFVMTSQGISTTEILLNNPAFAGSKFFGTSIEIIKYSSAPDSLNIRLSGSNEAVTSFNQNIPGLLAAFQTGGFRFRIGRIEATYATEKPVFHRKEKKNDASTDQGKGEGG